MLFNFKCQCKLIFLPSKDTGHTLPESESIAVCTGQTGESWAQTLTYSKNSAGRLSLTYLTNRAILCMHAQK